MISLTHSDLYRVLPSGKVIYEQIKLYLQSPKNDAMNTERRVSPTDMFFTYDHIGGIAGVAKWLTVASRYKVVLDVLLSDSYVQQIYSDIRFANAIIATEALIRIRLNRQRFKLEKELEKLAYEVGEIFQLLVGDVTHWAREVKTTRVDHIIHRGLYEGERPRLFLLSDSLYFLVGLSLLRECNVNDVVWQNIQNHKRFKWLADQLKR